MEKTRTSRNHLQIQKISLRRPRTPAPRAEFPAASGTPAVMRRTVPVLAVQDMRAALTFWEDVLGFARIIEFTRGGTPDTVHLARDQVEIIVRAAESLGPDALPYAISTIRVEVDHLHSLIPKLAQAGFGSGAEGNGLPSVFEYPVSVPGGHRIVLAQVHHA